MKKILIVLLAVAILATAGIALAGVSGTPHDVRTLTAGTEPCAYCHTPHQGSIDTYPLWNRLQAAQSYTPYSSNTFEMGPATGALDEGSAPCMVCHNGVASTLVNYPGRGSTANTNYDLGVGSIGSYGNNFANLGADLQNEHPVSFTYSNGLDAQGNNFPASAAGTIDASAQGINFPLYDAAGAPLNPTEFSCATCHTVHHTPVASYSAGAVPNEVYFLRTSNAGSAMCGACHTTKL